MSGATASIARMAARYLWLRAAEWTEIEEVYWFTADHETPEECMSAFDAAIDARIAAEMRYAITDAGRALLEGK